MIRLATADDAPGVHAIYAPVVRETPISFEWEVPDVAEMAARIGRVLESRPWLVYEQDGTVLGYSYASTFRERFAYRWTTEVSVYVHADARGRGLGSTLYRALFHVLRLQGYVAAIGGATMPNAATERLHLSLGFREVGRFPAAGYKHGCWHDVVFWRLTLRELAQPPAELLPLAAIIGTKEFRDAIEKPTHRI